MDCEDKKNCKRDSENEVEIVKTMSIFTYWFIVRRCQKFANEIVIC